MIWTVAAVVFVVALAGIALWRSREKAVQVTRAPRPPVKVEAADVATRSKRAPEPGAGAQPDHRFAWHKDDADDTDLTVMTLRPAFEDVPALEAPTPTFDDGDDDEEPHAKPSAVPIIYDAEASIDEPAAPTALILVSAVGQTDAGQRRKKNEDSYVMLDEQNLFVVADGMGGHSGGEVASSIAVDVIAQAFRANAFTGDAYANVPRRGSDLARAIQMANAAIYQQARAKPELTGMGTTVVSASFSPNKQRLYVGHVGDSRCYRFRGGELVQITTDHTMGAAGITGPLADRLERAVGIAPAVKVDIILALPQPEDRYLLCSDGLTKMVPEPEIRDVLRAEQDLASAAAKLIARANASGGRDNITVILVQVTRPPR